jgi:hypothetical protein
MKVQCPHCLREIEFGDELAGQVLNCSDCNGQMRAPLLETEELVGQVPPPLPVVDGLIPCSECGELIQAGMLKCRYCGGNVVKPGQEDGRNGPAWEHRGNVGRWSAFWATTKSILASPGETFSEMRLTGIGSAFSYSLVCAYVSFIISFAWQFLGQILPMMLMGQRSRGGFGGNSGLIFGGIIFGIIISLLVFPLLISLANFITAAFYHLGLKIMSGANEPFVATYRTVAYAMSAPCLLALIPICGGFIGGIWGLICLIVGLSRVHRTEWWRAALGIFIVGMGFFLLLILPVIFLLVNAGFFRGFGRF